MLQARFGQTAVARLAQAKRPHRLRRRAFYPLALRVEAPALCRASPCPGGGKGVVLIPRQHRNHPALVGRLGPRAAAAGRATAAVGSPELGADLSALTWAFHVPVPAGAVLAFWATHPALIPIHGEVGRAECSLDVALPTQVRPAGADQVYAVLLAGGDEMVRADVSGVHQVLGRR